MSILCALEIFVCGIFITKLNLSHYTSLYKLYFIEHVYVCGCGCVWVHVGCIEHATSIIYLLLENGI